MSDAQSTRLTRDALYELVWSKPLSKLAAEFGVASVVFTKHVDRLEVPRPPQGYWQQLARGQTPSRAPLPVATGSTPLDVVIERSPPLPKLADANGSTPAVQVAEKLSKPHPLVGQIQRSLHMGDHGQKVLYGGGHAVIRVGPDSEARALRILDALFKAMTVRGQDVRLRPAEATGRFILEVQFGEKDVLPFWLVEPLRRLEHRLSTEEKRKQARHQLWFVHKYDYTPSGVLELGTERPWGTAVRWRWADGKQSRLEDILGEVVLGLERVALARREKRKEYEREREIELAARHREEARQRTIAHRRALGESLVKAAHLWRDAELVREFLGAVGQRVPQSERSPEFEAWFAWAEEFARDLDPLVAPLRLVQALDPPESGGRG